MNKKAVKELTQKGCIVAKEAAEDLTDEDIQKIESLDSPPMYITEEMLSNLRQDQVSEDDVETVGEDSEGVSQELEAVEEAEEKEEEEREDLAEDSSEESVSQEDKEASGSSSPSAIGMKDTGSRNDRRTKVEVLDKADISKTEKDVPEFLNYYNDRYDRMKKLLTRRMELKSAVSIKRLERRDEGSEAATIGLVKDKYSTNSGKFIVELEDKTGTFKLLVDEREGERLVPDEVIGVTGSMGGDIIYADNVVHPDMPIPDGVNTTQDSVRAAYISDLHLGSIDTRFDMMEKFGDWLSQQKDVGYLVIPGDIVEGVGNYPGQEEELEVTDIYRQYQRFEEWVERLPEDLQIIVGPGNHDIVRLAEPQPRIPEKALPNISDFNNVHLVQNPQNVRLHGIRSKGILHLLYHGFSFDDHVDRIQDLREKAYDEPHHVMIDLLKRRHLAPSYGSNLMSPEGKDYLAIEREPDVMVSGHFHSHANESYKGVNVICASSFQGQTDFQKRVGHQPQPGYVTLMDFKTRNTEVKRFWT